VYSILAIKCSAKARMKCVAPPEIMEKAKIATNNLLPKKFRDRYECLSKIYELERKE
jgi:hypothetical protein